MATVEKVQVTAYTLTLTDEEARNLHRTLGAVSTSYDVYQVLHDVLDPDY